MMKGSFLSQQQQQLLMDQTLSNLTSPSSPNNQTQFFSPPPPKRKRNLAGNPDAEVIALSPKTLMATNRFVCEICNKGFQRDQNLQLHRRGHNLPWKLKQRSNKEVIKKKVYVCPEPSCVHHDPLRALGDLTGIKKHFCRKHGEKKWKCDKCSKKYAVQSDWKAHSKICGTKEYKCDCGTLFSRRDSFITHRAFCDALADESARSAMELSPLISNYNNLQELLFKRGFGGGDSSNNDDNNLKTEIPSWLQPDEIFVGSTHQTLNPNPSGLVPPCVSSPHISATALLQKAAQMGATMSSPLMGRTHEVVHVSTGNYGEMGIRSREGGMGVSCSSISCCTDYGNKAAAVSAAVTATATPSGPTTFLHDMINSLASASHPFHQDSSAFNAAAIAAMHHHTAAGRSDGLTRDFLGLRSLSHGDILSITGFGNCIVPNSATLQSQTQKPWQG
ncbi:protein indeterminate-domain 11-like isoform X2 [Cucurbita maxima]|uniref:Protein indeterminate-domain 11-like isoform X2 n=1 Tax=Cucurbita maxima TaxID=3661 RepID=A0A6J1KHF0_CUCMA|nr:protein indeterminate-domain 11-like isoform X2 [Cucurbita maxima]